MCKKSCITSVDLSINRKCALFEVLYDDGEREEKVCFYAVRFSDRNLHERIEAWKALRDELLKRALSHTSFECHSIRNMK